MLKETIFAVFAPGLNLEMNHSCTSVSIGESFQALGNSLFPWIHSGLCSVGADCASVCCGMLKALMN